MSTVDVFVGNNFFSDTYEYVKLVELFGKPKIRCNRGESGSWDWHYAYDHNTAILTFDSEEDAVHAKLIL